MKQSFIGRTAPLLLLFALLLSACGAAAEPAAPSAAAETAAPAPVYSDALRFSELMAKNRATLADDRGAFPDWIELCNEGTEALDLEGWSLSDGEDKAGWRFPAISIAPGERLLVFADPDARAAEGRLCASFGLSKGETLCLRAPDGTLKDTITVLDTQADLSQLPGEDLACAWPTPGYPNDREGYLAFLAARDIGDALRIHEVLVYNSRYLKDFLGGYCDLVELKNCSDEELWLGGYTIADKSGDAPTPLPDRMLAPGELFIVYCSGDSSFSRSHAFHTGFSLDAQSECLYLRHSDGTLADYTALHGLPVGSSCGRMPGEPGFFYFAQPSPGSENTEGKRFLSPIPTAGTEPGVYEGVDALTLTLSAEDPFYPDGSFLFYYTTDGTPPDESAALWTGPLETGRSCVLRAVAVAEDSIPSAVGTFGYFLNENVHLPLLSITVDDKNEFLRNYNAAAKGFPMPGNLSLYDGEHSFSQDGELSIKGFTSLSLPKKSLGFAFPGGMGGPLEADVFGNGVTRFTHLSIRAGQDNIKTLFRTELVQALAEESSEHLLVQSSKFCVVFVNGEYWGLYALKEDLTRGYYAEHYGVSKDSVTNLKGALPPDTLFYQEVLRYANEHDLSDPACYAEISRRMDVDSFIDWIIFEGYSGNSDTLNNIRFFRSDEGDRLWRWALFDLDWAFYNPYNSFFVIMNSEANSGYQMYYLMWRLFENPDFKAAFLRRCGELFPTVLSNEHVLAEIDRWAALLDPEIARDEKLRHISYKTWLEEVDAFKRFFADNDYDALCIRQLSRLFGMKEEEIRAAMAG